MNSPGLSSRALGRDQDDTGPVMVIVAGPNGSSKSTTTAQFSKDGYEVIDPDRIARNLSSNSPEEPKNYISRDDVEHSEFYHRLATTLLAEGLARRT